jgi:hypothetical protein
MYAFKKANEDKFLRGVSQPKLSSVIRTFDTEEEANDYLVAICEQGDGSGPVNDAVELLHNTPLELVEIAVIRTIKTIPSLSDLE